MTSSAVSAAAIAAAEEMLRETGTPGAAIAVKIDDDPVASAGIGALHPGGTAPMPTEARMPLYSITKTLLAAATLRLADAGRLTLDTDVRELASGINLPVRITLRQLLNHTGGLPDYGGLPEYARALRADPAHPWTDEEFLDRTLRAGLVFAPGEGWAYSNIGYLIVRRIVETEGGDGSLAAGLDRLVFEPAGIGGMAVATSVADMSGLAPGYSQQLGHDSEMRDVRSRYHPGWVAHGLVTGTAVDTAGLIAALFDGGMLAPETLAAMLRPVPVGGVHPPFRAAGYGLGLMIDRDPEVALVAGHAGGGPGYSTAAFRFETAAGRRVTSVALANRDGGEVGLRIAFALARIALGLPM